jgi:hypothetical protein
MNLMTSIAAGIVAVGLTAGVASARECPCRIVHHPHYRSTTYLYRTVHARPVYRHYRHHRYAYVRGPRYYREEVYYQPSYAPDYPYGYNSEYWPTHSYGGGPGVIFQYGGGWDGNRRWEHEGREGHEHWREESREGHGWHGEGRHHGDDDDR